MAQQTPAASKCEIEDLRGQVAGLQAEVERCKEAGETLRQSEERFRSLVENANDAIVVLQDGKVVFRNPLYETLLGYTVAETRDRLFLENVAPEDREQVRDYHARRIRGETAPEQYEVRILTRSGRKLTMEVRPRVIEYGGKPAAMVIMRDVTERVQQEQAVRQSEERFRLLAENAHDIVYYFRLAPTPSLEYISPAAEAILGYTPAEFLGYPDLLTDIIHPDDRHLMGTLLQNDQHTDQPITLRALPKHGGVKWIELSRSVIHDDSGQPVAIQGIVRDVTERKEAEEALSQSEERFRMLAENAQDMIFRYRLAEPPGLQYVSPASVRITGYSPEEFCADPEIGSKLLHPDDRSFLEQTSANPAAMTQPMQLRMTTKSGRVIWVDILQTPIYDDSGKMVAIEGIVRDVTERVEAEEALRQSEERFRLLAENAQDIVFILGLNPEPKMEYISHSVKHILGYTPTEIVGNPNLSTDIIHPDDQHLMGTLLQIDEHADQPISLRVLPKHGGVKWIELSWSVIHDDSGQPMAIQGIVRDVTERVQQEQAVRQSEERFRLLAENAPDMIFRYRMAESGERDYISPAGQYDYVSPGVFRILGYTPDEMYADPGLFRKAVHPDYASIAIADHPNRLIATEDFHVGPPIKRFHKSGKIVWTETRTTLIHDTTGNLVAVEGIIRDVTERMETEEALRRSEEGFRLLAENAQDMIYRYSFDQEGVYEYISPAIKTILGYEPGELYANPRLLREAIHPDDREMVAAAVASNRFDRPVTSRIFSKDGRMKWLETKTTPLIDSSGKIVAVEGISRDVTERMEAEEALRASEERFRLLAENAQDMIYRYRIESSAYDYVSPGVFRILGYTPDELYADPGLFRKAVHPDDESIAEEQDRLKETEDFYVGPPIKRVHKSGQIVWTESRTTLLRDTAGTAVAIEGVVRDVTERKVAEEALRQSEERFRLLAENARDMIYRVRVAEPRGFEYVSPGCERILGYTPEEFYADPEIGSKLFHPDDRLLIQRKRDDPAAMSEPMTIRSITKSGRGIWVDLVRTPIYDDAGNLVAIEGIVRDVTERIEAQEKLRESEERFRLLAENAQDIVYRVRVKPEPKIEYVSPSVERILGYTPEEYYADPSLVERTIHEDDRHLRVPDRFEDESAVQTRRLRWIARDGRTVWIERRSSPIRDADGEIVGWHGISRDVTEQVRLLEEVRAGEEQFRLLAENAQDIVYRLRVRPEPKVEYVSPSIERILGYTPDEYYADPSLGKQTIHEDDRRLSLLDPIVGEKEAQPQLVRCIAKDGRTVWMERRSSPIRDADGQIVGWNGISRDVTEQVRLLEQVRAGEERLRAFSRRLVETQEADRRFIALELHDEIGQLLTGIKMSQEQLGRNGQADKRTLKRAFKLVEDAMDRVQDLSLELRPAMLDHLGIVPTLRWYVKRYASRNGVEVKLSQTGVNRRFDPDLETAVFRIVQEGLTNVARHSHTGRATVQIRVIGNVLHLAVEDSGQGFDAETALDSPKSVGLVGMIERATSLGGELRIDSAPGHGTRLNATFPLNGNPGTTE